MIKFGHSLEAVSISRVPVLNEILRDFRWNKKFHLFFILNLSFGLIGLVGLLGFKSSFQESINKRSRNILGSDLAINSRVAFTEDQMKRVDSVLPEGHIKVTGLSMFSMLKSGEKTRLVNVRTLPEQFPFYGTMTLRQESGRTKTFNSGQSVWIYPELATQLGLVIGDSISLGYANFKIENIVDKDPQQSFQMGAMAPKVYISEAGEKRAGFIKKVARPVTVFISNLKSLKILRPSRKKLKMSSLKSDHESLHPKKRVSKWGAFCSTYLTF